MTKDAPLRLENYLPELSNTYVNNCNREIIREITEGEHGDFVKQASPRHSLTLSSATYLSRWGGASKEGVAAHILMSSSEPEKYADTNVLRAVMTANKTEDAPATPPKLLVDLMKEVKALRETSPEDFGLALQGAHRDIRLSAIAQAARQIRTVIKLTQGKAPDDEVLMPPLRCIDRQTPGQVMPVAAALKRVNHVTEDVKPLIGSTGALTLENYFIQQQKALESLLNPPTAPKAAVIDVEKASRMVLDRFYEKKGIKPD